VGHDDLARIRAGAVRPAAADGSRQVKQVPGTHALPDARGRLRSAVDWQRGLAFIMQREAIRMRAKSTTLFTLAAASAGLGSRTTSSSLGTSGRDGIKGSASFIYQDGRDNFTGIYKGTLSGKGKLSIRFYKGTISHGKIVLHGRGTVLTGSYRKDSLHLNGCASVLPWAGKIGLSCTFAHHGHTP